MKKKKQVKRQRPSKPKLQLKPIREVARVIGMREKYLECYGPHKAKVSLDILTAVKKKKRGKYVLISSITPTPLGEGKTTQAIGLSMALNRLKKRSVACLLEPSFGGVLGIKGTGTGGGLSQAYPRDDANLNLMGDSRAVVVAQNLCASYIDNSIFFGNPLHIDPNSITLKRLTSVNDRFLRSISTGLGSKSDGIPRRTGFEQASSSELMSILALSEDYKDLRERVGRIIIGYTEKGKPITCEDLKVAGSMAAVLRDALKPNLLQTREGTPCFMHTGSSGDTALGSGSVIADKIALGLCDYVISESGFGADLGAEKFFDIKCRISGLKADAVVIVCSIRGLKMHSGDCEVFMGKPLPREIYRENVSAVERGFSNLEKQLENLQTFGVPIVVCINRFKDDTEKEIEAIKKRVAGLGGVRVAVSDVYARGGEGGADLAESLIEACKERGQFRYLYPVDIPLKDKIRRIARTMYGAKEVSFSESAGKKAIQFKKLKIDNLPVCMDKTHLSLSPSSKRKGRPHGFKYPVEDIQVFGGAGYIVASSIGSPRTLPGFPKVPRGVKVNIDEDGRITGLF